MKTPISAAYPPNDGLRFTQHITSITSPGPPAKASALIQVARADIRAVQNTIRCGLGDYTAGAQCNSAQSWVAECAQSVGL